jgi:hypothetical protein
MSQALIVGFVVFVLCLIAMFFGGNIFIHWINRLEEQISKLKENLAQLAEQMKNFKVRPQNIIHLGIKPGAITTDMEPTKLSVEPKDFVVRADKLRKNLLNALATKEHPNTGTRAYCILDSAGIGEIIDGASFQNMKNALTRLLINDDREAIVNFLSTLADSVASATIPATDSSTSAQ